MRNVAERDTEKSRPASPGESAGVMRSRPCWLRPKQEAAPHASKNAHPGSAPGSLRGRVRNGLARGHRIARSSHAVCHCRAGATVFDDVASHAARSNGNEFCKRFAYQVEACEGVWKEADDFCLKPGAKPRVIRSAPVRSTKESAGGRVLELEGLTAGGQRYVSEFFVTVADGNPRASVGVYWTGLGLAESPLGDGNTVLPTSECA